MELAAFVRALEVLGSPLDWGGREAWLAECLRRVRAARGVDAGDLEDLLALPGDEPGWLRRVLEGTGSRSLPSAALAGGDPGQVSLRCAFGAGLAALARLRAWRGTLGRAFDDVDTGMAVFTADGQRDVVRNARWDEMLGDEPDRTRLRQLVASQAASAASGVGEGAVEAELAGGSYRVVASRMAGGMLLDDPAVLVLLDRPGPELPTTRELRLAFGLRGREPQVALLAAEGLSNADIARRLRLSTHTVRHYLERVMDRLGLHSRKALAMRLMDGSGARQPSDRV